MKCTGCDLRDGGGFKSCEDDATRHVWCPTWCDSYQGPRDFCDRHSQNFLNSEDGQFFYGDAADEAFKSIVQIIRNNDERYQNVKGMLMNGTHVAGKKVIETTFRSGMFVVDGEMWLLSEHHAIHLGKYADAKERFPKLMAMPKID